MNKNKNFGKYTSFAVATAVASLAVIMPEIAVAGPADITALANTAKGNIQSIKSLAISIAFMLGVILFIAGLYLIYKDSKQPGQDHAKKGFISIIVGTCLLILPLMVDVASGSLGGNEVSNTSFKDDATF